MSALWSHIHSQLDHGQSMSFTVTKTGIEGELMITIHPGKQNEALEWFPPIIFRNNCHILDQKFEEEFRQIPIEKAMDCFRNKDIFVGSVNALSALMKSFNASQELPKQKQKAKQVKQLADSFFRMGKWQEAMDNYVILNNIAPDEFAATRIQVCLAAITKENQNPDAPETLTDPFKDETGFGKKK